MSSEQTRKTAGTKPLGLGGQVIAGGVAGTVEILTMYPTDVAKTRAQLASQKGLSMASILRTLARTEGLRGLYRGIASPIVAEAPKRAVKFASNEQYKILLRDSNGKLSTGRAGIAGGLAGVTEALVNCPFETVKVRMQSVGSTSLYRSTLHCATTIVQKEGISRLYAGLEAHMWRNLVWNGAYFAVINVGTALMPPPATATKMDTLVHKFVSGFIGGTAGVILNTPTDVVKSRMQNQPAGQLKYNWTLPSIVTIFREEGPRSLWKGLGPRIVRLGPGGGVMLIVFDFMSDFLCGL